MDLIAKFIYQSELKNNTNTKVDLITGDQKELNFLNEYRTYYPYK